jgi:hypothetical protein
MKIDPGVPENQRKTVMADLNYLDQVRPKGEAADQETAKILEMGRLTAQSLRAWLDARMTTIIPESIVLEKSVRLLSPAAFYQNPGLLPDIDPAVPTPTPKPSNGAGTGNQFKPVVVMSNTGAGIYMFGKQKAKLLGLKLSDGSVVAVKSPRSGIIQIGEGLFLPRLQVNLENPEGSANRIGRLSTFFHEARHSDGGGKSLAFAHAMCPVGHAYQGYYACEKNLNGPYTVGAKTIKSLNEACSDCSAKEKTTLQMIQADSLSRVLPKFVRNGVTETPKMWKTAPERVLYVVGDGS